MFGIVLGVIIILQVVDTILLVIRTRPHETPPNPAPMSLFSPPPHAPQPATSTAAKPADVPEPLSAGALALRDNCGACHAVPSPAKHTAAEWRVILPNELKRIRTPRGPAFFGGGPALHVPSEKEWQILQSYLTRHARP